MSDEFNFQQPPKNKSKGQIVKECALGAFAFVFVFGLIYVDGKFMDMYYEKYYWPQFEQIQAQQQKANQQYQQTQMQIKAKRDTTLRVISR